MIKKVDIKSLTERKSLYPLIYFLFITIQTWNGVECVLIRSIISKKELKRTFALVQSNPIKRQMMKLAGFKMTAEQFIAQKGRFTFVTYEPTDDPQSRCSRSIWHGLEQFYYLSSSCLYEFGCCKKFAFFLETLWI